VKATTSDAHNRVSSSTCEPAKAHLGAKRPGLALSLMAVLACW
jgi:hypothetical protein